MGCVSCCYFIVILQRNHFLNWGLVCQTLILRFTRLLLNFKLCFLWIFELTAANFFFVNDYLVFLYFYYWKLNLIFWLCLNLHWSILVTRTVLCFWNSNPLFRRFILRFYFVVLRFRKTLQISLGRHVDHESVVVFRRARSSYEFWL
jgi:hypothetical protein